MRFLALVCLLAGSVAAASAAELKIVRLLPGYRTTASFQRLSEFLTGRENTGKDTVLRSQPAARDGYYWFFRLENRDVAIAEAVFELQVITPAGPDPKTFTFRAPVPHGTPVFYLGVTGADWPGPTDEPVAWSLRIRTAAGDLAAAQSFLWSKPAAPAK
jgi:hypothetical protein